ncbi:non-ribosomal peptide synthetase [Longimicrobium sp.]|uniref:non-ribosomal peptide synthetase n=1 Tax=Longimicrobium sp. TaxID=2029185 RepID=UPI002CF3C493|nr:non-ribosomal peptide synthetase [Longimicrobium sp.]HSU17579.1 amino acid adenylation domain-containing protein [Longimicrobium sp.]
MRSDVGTSSSAGHLPAPQGGDGWPGYAVPVGEVEAAVAEIWQQVLRAPRVGRGDDFFALGGDSLLGARVAARVRQALGVDVAVGEVFERPVLAEFARGVAQAAHAELPPIAAADRGGRLALSFAQQRVWFLEQLGLPGVYNIPRQLWLRGELDAEALARALDRIVHRHEALRTSFHAMDGEPEQRVAPAESSRFPLAHHDLSADPQADAELRRLIAEEAVAPFDLENGPLARGRLVRLAADDHVLLVTLHHIVADGWSMEVLVDELGVLYPAFRRGAADPLPALPVQYADYVAWQRRWVEDEVLEEQAAYWSRALAGIPELLELPLDHARPARQDHAGASVALELDEALTAGLKALGRRHGTTLYQTLLAGWAVVLGRLAGQTDVVIGSPVANRGRGEIEGLIGFFVNTLALRIDLADAPTVAELLGRVRERAIAAQHNQDLPFEQVVDRVQPTRSLAHNPVFQVVFSWQNVRRSRLALPGLAPAVLERSPQPSAKFDLSLSLQEVGGRIAGGVEYATSLFQAETVERWMGYLRRVLEAMVAGDGQRVDSISLLPDAERRQVVETWNATALDYPRDLCIHQRFEAQAARTPHADAVVSERGALTYAQLNARANRLAHHLRALGVRPDSRVAVCVERGTEMVEALLAVVKAGGAYVPMDPAYPDERLRYMLADSAPVALLTQASLAARFADVDLPVLDLGDDAAWADRDATNPARESVGLDAGHLAYVVYTSGSTGTPKGVQVEHRSLGNLVAWHCDAFALREGDRSSSVAGFGFDASTWEIWPPLCAGAALHLPAARDPEALLEWWAKQPLDVCFLPTPLAELAFERGIAPATLRTLLVGGDRLRTLPADARYTVINNYGPTETTVVATSGEVGAADRLHIGRGIANTQVYVLDARGEPVPVGVAGELYVGGASVARGYLGRPGLTAERFVPDPFAAEPGAWMYRTGDLVRWRAGGTIEFLGRNDFQVKVRGFRIEPGEIETRLAGHPQVRAAVVLARESAGDPRLVAWYVADAAIDAEALRAFAAERLPEYMVPAAFVRLEALPLTPNGKVDRRALPAPDAGAFAARGYEAPEGETEAVLAEIWAELLGVARVGRGDNFFELGGHSLLAVKLTERMRQRGLHARVQDLFGAPTLARLAAVAGTEAREIEVPASRIPAACDAITPEMLPLVELAQGEIDGIVATVDGGAANVQDIYPLAPLQEGILFHHLMAEDGDPYVLAGISLFESRERLDAYVAALQAVIDRHDVLRSSVAWEGLREPVQVVWRRAKLEVVEVELEPGEGDAARRLWTWVAPLRRRMDLRRAPLIRLYAARGEDGGWVLLDQLHHVVADHVTKEALEDEIHAHLAGRGGELPEPIAFRDHVARARMRVTQAEHEAFFGALLGDVEEPTAPFGLADAWGDGLDLDEGVLAVDPALAIRLRDRARRLGVSAASFCHVAWAQVLARVSGRDDVVFGTVLFGRMQGGEGADRVLGPFMNTLPFRVRVGAERAEGGVLATHRQLAGLLRHENASLALAQRCSRVEAPAPLFTALLNYRHSRALGEQTPAQAGLPEGIRRLRMLTRNSYPLTLNVDDRGESLSFKVFAPASVGPGRVCALVERALAGLVDALETAPERPLRAIEVLPEAERRQVVEGWNATAAEYPHAACLHHLFEAQVERTPDALALTFEGDSITYRELNARANRIAHHLVARGVGPDVRVGLCVERSLEMMAGLLGVLKAGGAYVALDPEYPEERLRYMLVDSEPAVLLTCGASADRFGGLGVPVVALDRDAAAWSHLPETNPERAVTPNHLAYLIYTSGSTGQPKGVMVEHRAIVNVLAWMNAAWRLDSTDVVLQKTPYSFDASLRELIPALLVGARMVVARPGGHRDARYMLETIRRERVTTLHFVPSMLQVLVQEADFGECTHLKRVVCGGEALPPELVKRFHQHLPDTRLYNVYGPTEAAVDVTEWSCAAGDERDRIPIGHPMANVRMYVLDGDAQPVPAGVVGELYIGGVQVARGYRNRPELTAERFVADPFSGEAGARLYRTGDLGRWLADGAIEVMGRADAQVKVRGFRIELGEIESRLIDHPQIREAVVIAREDSPGDRRLVAYYVADGAVDADALRAHLAERLPEYMVPAACLALDELPRTPNGKLDRRALPAPEDDAFARRGFEAPQGETEEALAEIWCQVLGVERVGRWDNFAELGGHSLRAMMVAGRMRKRGLHAEVSALFTTTSLAELAGVVRSKSSDVAVPANRIPTPCTAITPAMLPLVELGQGEIDRVVAGVEGGAANVQDIYPLAPLQEGILFHHLLAAEGDPYLLAVVYGFDTRWRLDAYLGALQAVIDRHDVLRTAVMWEGLREPVQVVCRRAVLPVEEVELEGEGDAVRRLYDRFDPRLHRLDVRRAPIMRAVVARDEARGRWLLLVLRHHLVSDHQAQEVLQAEVEAHLLGRAASLPAPLPFRDYVAQARLGVSRAEHEAYFRKLLADVDEPTAPFGLLDVRGDGSGVAEARLPVDGKLAATLRDRARKLGVSAAALCHVAWAQVLARVSGRDDVVFGTVLFGRMKGGEGADRVLGLFNNTLPVRVRVADEGAEAAVRGAHRQLAELLRHEHASLALAQRCSGVEAPAPLFTALLNYRHSGGGAGKAARASDFEPIYGVGRTNYPLTLSVDDRGEALSLTSVAPASVGADRVCAMMHRALEGLAEALETAPARPLARVDVLPAAERRAALEARNATEAAYPGACVHELVEAQAARTPDAVALVFHGEQVTYGELNARANRLAHALIARGVGADVRVAVCAERGVEMMVALLAVLKAGGAYVPLDPAYPADRVGYVLRHGAPAVVLTQASLSDRFGGMEIPVFRLDADAGTWADLSAANPARGRVRPGNLAYVIYTSGSTGEPKGVMNTHGGVVNLLASIGGTVGMTPADRLIAVTTISFDISVLELFLPLVTGARVELLDRASSADPEALMRAIAAGGATVMQATPATWRMLVDAGWEGDANLRALCGGEALPAELAARLRERVGALWNVYGPTETTIWSSVQPVDADGSLSTASVAIGGPLANTRFYLLDRRGEPVPAGVAGELYIGGAGVARGYLGRPALTAERFVPDAFASTPGARMYRTGDLARWCESAKVRECGSTSSARDGRTAALPHSRTSVLEFLGRNDFQVKVRGFRIELGEIEARLAAFPGIREAVVVAREDVPGDRRLAAYFVGEGETEALRAHLAAALPEYMVPAAYVRMDAFPLTPNGKLDRRALPAPEGDAFAAREWEAPVGETESALAEIWAEVLGADRVGRRDGFFELGGHSLVAVRMISRVRQVLGVEAALGELFDRPTLAEFARTLDAAARADLPPIGRADRGAALPLSHAQQRLWFLEQLGDLGPAYHVRSRVRLRGELDRTALVRALDRIAERHEALRTTFAGNDGEPEQRIAPVSDARFPLREHDLREHGDAEQMLDRLMADEATAAFDLSRGPLARARLIRLADDDHVLLVTLHHAVSDAWSMGVLTDELGALYAAFRRGERDPLAPLPVQYADYAAWQRRWVDGGAVRAQADYWKATLAGAPELLELPLDHARPARQDHAGATLPLELDEALTAGVKALARRHGATPFMALMAAWATVLARLSGQHDVVIGTPTANRGRREVEGLIGFFVNTLALRVDLSDSPSVATLLGRVKARALEAQQNQDIPFEQVVELVQPARSLAHSPVFQVMFAWQSAPRGTLQLPGLEPAALPGATLATSKFDLSLQLREADGRIVGGMEYATSLFEAATVERIAGYLRRAVAEMVADDPRPAERLALVPEDERWRVLHTWNATAASYPSWSAVHELFEARAKRTPAAAAIVDGAATVTYAELNARANRLAHHLAARGVGAGTRVAILLPRSAELVAAELAVLKAGAAYVPLDATYPAERIAFMVADSGCGVLLSQSGEQVPHLPNVERIDIDRVVDGDTENLRITSGGESVAYVMYTSGSTGEPKGVMVPHRAITQLVMTNGFADLDADDRVALASNPAFDAATMEVWGPLLNGGRIVVVPQDVLLDPEAYGTLLVNQGVTTILITPVLFNHYARVIPVALAGLKQILTGGDKADPAAYARVLAERGRVTIYNCYGPTETTCFSIAHDVVGVTEDTRVVPIGRPKGNTRVYVLDAACEPVPTGAVGELYVGGHGVALGYWNRADLTAERFVSDPFGGEPGARLYRTGDLVRWKADGRLEFVGRNDFQVKVRGFRIELSEIESRLAEHAAVRESVVVAREDGPGDKRLVAYFVGEEADVDALRAHLAERLPEYMVPAAYVRLEAMPRTGTGKVDRRALPAPEGDAYARRGYEAPEGETETILARLWSEVLGVERVGRHDHFFELGGHSLMASKLVPRIKQHMEVDVALGDVFEHPVLWQLANAILDAQLAQFSAIDIANLTALVRPAPVT